MLQSNPQALKKPLSYSQIVSKNLKRKKDETDNEYNNINIIDNYKNNNITNINFNNNNNNNNNNSKTSEEISKKMGNEPSTEITEKRKVTPVLQQVTKNNIEDLRKVYLSTFPLSYNSEFYSDIINVYPKALSRVATYHNIVVGGICCRLEKKTLRDIQKEMPSYSLSSDLSFTQQINHLKLLNTYSCYIMAIAVLEPYQSLSIGSRLMSYIIKYCENNKEISSINLHVHVKNEKAIKFYKKYGFYQKEFIRNYYFNNPNIIPPDVYYFQKDLY